MAGNKLRIGNVLGKNEPLDLPASARERHLYVCGGTGVGKSKLLEHCIREDIVNWRDSRCGLILFDPHGLAYENTMAFLARHGLDRPVVPIDLGRTDWTVSYNLLRRKEGADPSVLVADFVDALAHVWGAGNTNETPLFERLASVILLTLYQNGMTVTDIVHLLSRADIRQAMIAKIQNHGMARYTWQIAERDPKEFQRQISSTLNRFNRIVEVESMKATFGQPDVSLDLLTAIKEGYIILVNLSTKGGRVSEENAKTLGTLLLTDLWTAARDRGKAEQGDHKPFYVYIDECQKFVTPTIAENLDQARGFGLHLTLAHQFPRQLINAGPHGQAMYDSILGTVGNQIVFRLRHPDDVKIMGHQLFMDTFDPDQIKLILKSTKVMGYREETRESETSSHSSTAGNSSGSGGGRFEGESSGESAGAENWNNSVSKASGESENWSENESYSETTGTSVTTTSVMVPIMGEETSSVQYRSLEEQLFVAMQRLSSQEDRHFAIRYHGGPKAPLFVKTPTVSPATTAKDVTEAYREKILRSWPFALSTTEALKRVEGREHKLLTDIDNLFDENEPATSKRRIK